MTQQAQSTGERRANGGRRLGLWFIAIAIILLVPWVAMRFTNEVAWDAADFVFAAVLLVGTGAAYELAAWRTGSTAYRAAVGIALASVFALVWINAAVGIIGAESNRANLMFGAVLFVGIAGAAVARLRPRGMARALFATALAQVLVAVVAVAAGLGAGAASWPLDVIVLTGFFTALWTASALLFRKAAREEERQRAGSRLR